MGSAVAPKVYLDENGNEVKPKKVYLDEQGNEISAAAPPDALDEQLRLMKEKAEVPWYKRAASDFAGEAWKQINPVTAIQGLAQAAAHPIDTAGALLQGQGEIANRALESAKQGNYIEAARHFANYMVPVIGQQTDAAGDMAQSGQYAKAAGATAGLAANIAAPELIKGIPAVPQGVRTAATKLSEGMYQSALKPPVTASAGKVAGMVKAGLEGDIPVSAAGVEKIGTLIDNLNHQISAEIKTQPTRMISKFKVAGRLSDVADEFSNQVNPVKDLEAVSKSGNEFLQTQPKQITAEAAQALKVGTYKQVAGKYGELGNAAIESQKALARGLKEELATAFPELNNLNAQEGRLLDLQPALERAVQRSSNHQIIGIGTPVAGASAGIVTGSAKIAATVAAVKAILDNPLVKSKLATAIYWGAKKNNPGITAAIANARVKGYINALGNSIQNGSQIEAGQIAEQQ